MTVAALIRHAASTLERTAALSRERTEPAPPEYWQGADDALAWVIATLRAQAELIAADGARFSRLRELATRATPDPWTAEAAGNAVRLSGGDPVHRIGVTESGAAGAFIAAAQPAIVLALLAAIEHPNAPAPYLDDIELAARAAPRGPWTHVGMFLLSGEDNLGWLHLSCDVDYVVAASPETVLDLCEWVRATRDSA